MPNQQLTFLLRGIFILSFCLVNKSNFEMSGTIGTDPLFLGLTRPPMLFGVSYTFAALNGIISLLAFVITSKFFYLLVLLPGLHLIGYFICLKEPRAIELFIARMSKCNICRNRYYHSGTNSYDVY